MCLLDDKLRSSMGDKSELCSERKGAVEYCFSKWLLNHMTLLCERSVSAENSTDNQHCIFPLVLVRGSIMFESESYQLDVHVSPDAFQQLAEQCVQTGGLRFDRWQEINMSMLLCLVHLSNNMHLFANMFLIRTWRVNTVRCYWLVSIVFLFVGQQMDDADNAPFTAI